MSDSKDRKEGSLECPCMEGGFGALPPEAINQDPYGEGWLAVIAARDGGAGRERLLDPQAYFEGMKEEAQEEATTR